MPYDSPAWRMADRLTGGELDAIVADLLAEGQSWSAVSRRLKKDHGAEVTRVTLAKWYPHLSPAEPVGEAS